MSRNRQNPTAPPPDASNNRLGVDSRRRRMRARGALCPIPEDETKKTVPKGVTIAQARALVGTVLADYARGKRKLWGHA
ncbi:hypothetical protein NXT3_PB00419 (plasmid) [Sinorhizobium fredii]|uniref:Uncharacterized protein n=1 Tax=Rhizobium fredii TaxID=380 RepID=A0A2L0HC59_RHIFR|nr:hypothetical protein NXT3_PB00419 [Sinorhizobium fredii]